MSTEKSRIICILSINTATRERVRLRVSFFLLKQFQLITRRPIQSGTKWNVFLRPASHVFGNETVFFLISYRALDFATITFSLPCAIPSSFRVCFFIVKISFFRKTLHDFGDSVTSVWTSSVTVCRFSQEKKETISEEIITLLFGLLLSSSWNQCAGGWAKLSEYFFTMRATNCAILSAFLLLSAVLSQPNDDEEYADVSCQYHWGGTVCDCEYMKYVRKPPYVGSWKFFFIHFFVAYF